MCITSVGRILQIDENIAVVKLRKSKRKVRIDLIDVDEGDYVYVAGNIAIEKIDKKEAKEILAMKG